MCLTRHGKPAGMCAWAGLVRQGLSTPYPSASFGGPVKSERPAAGLAQPPVAVHGSL